MKLFIIILSCFFLSSCSKGHKIIIYNDTNKIIYVLKSDLKEHEIEPKSSTNAGMLGAVKIRMGDRIYSKRLQLGNKKFFSKYAEPTFFSSYRVHLKHQGYNQILIKHNDGSWQPL